MSAAALLVAFALDKSRGGIVTLPEEATSTGGPYTCVGGCPLVLRASSSSARIRQHFAHLPTTTTSNGTEAASLCNGESLEHKTAKLLLAQRVGEYRLMRACKVCGDPAGPKIEFDPRLVVGKDEVSVLEGKFRLDVAILDGKTREVVAAIEVFHTHAVDADKWTALSGQYAGRLYEVTSKVVLSAFGLLRRKGRKRKRRRQCHGNPDRKKKPGGEEPEEGKGAEWRPIGDKIGDLSEGIVLPCKAADALVCERCTKRAEDEAAQQARKLLRPCADGECKRRWQKKTEMTLLAGRTVPNRWFRSCLVEQFVCNACLIHCPSCRLPCTRSYLSRTAHCYACNERATEWWTSVQEARRRSSMPLLLGLANEAPEWKLAERETLWEWVADLNMAHAIVRRKRSFFAIWKSHSQGRLIALRKRKQEKENERVILQRRFEEEQKTKRDEEERARLLTAAKTAHEQRAKQETEAKRISDERMAKCAARVNRMIEGKEWILLDIPRGEASEDAFVLGMRPHPVSALASASSLHVLLACRQWLHVHNERDLRQYLDIVYPAEEEKKRIASLRNPARRVARLISGEEAVVLAGWHHIPDMLTAGAVRDADGEFRVRTLETLLSCRRFIKLADADLKEYVDATYPAKHPPPPPPLAGAAGKKETKTSHK